MDTLCGIGLPELVVLALLGFVLIGPERSREVALSLGRTLRTVLKSEWWQEINRVAKAIRDLPNTLVRMAELEDALKETERELQETQDELRRTLRSDAPTQPRGPSPDTADAPSEQEGG
jgi:Sec-independent protein translocase protein TatA